MGSDLDLIGMVPDSGHGSFRSVLLGDGPLAGLQVADLASDDGESESDRVGVVTGGQVPSVEPDFNDDWRVSAPGANQTVRGGPAAVAVAAPGLLMRLLLSPITPFVLAAYILGRERTSRDGGKL